MTVGNNSESFRFLFGTQFEKSWIVGHGCDDIDNGVWCPLDIFNYTASNGTYEAKSSFGVITRTINESLGFFVEADDDAPQIMFDDFSFTLIEDLSDRDDNSIE